VESFTNKESGMIRAFSLIGALLVLATSVPLRAAEEPFDFYAVMSLTGPAAFLGRGAGQGVQAFERYINAHGGIRGRPLHVVIEDDQSNAQVAVQLVNQIIAKGVSSYIGPAFGQTCAATQPLILAAGPVEYCLSPAIVPPAGSFSFSTMPANRDQFANALRYIRAKGIKTMALLSSTDASGQDQANGLLQVLKYRELSDMKVLTQEHMAVGDVSATAQIARMKAFNPQILLILVNGTSFATALRAINDVGFDGPVMTSSGNAVREQIMGYASFLPKTLIFTTLPFQMDVGIAPAVRQARNIFVAALKEITPEPPGVPQGISWDPLTLLVDAYRKIGPQATAAQVRDYLLGVHGFAGIMGYYDFRGKDQRGLDLRSTGAMVWDKSSQTFVVVSRPGGEPL